MSKGKFTGDISFTNCAVTVKSVKIGRLYLHRVRAWDGLGTPLVAMRVWSETPFERGMLMQMQPIEAPRSHINPTVALAALEEAMEDALRAEATEATGAPAPRDAGAEGGAV
jgi:hypothetical protein